MGLIELIKGLLSQSKKIELSTLPSQGIFYLPDFEISIRKADQEDIIDYEYNFDKENFFSVIDLIKKIVRKNTILSKNYKFDDIKSLDLVYLFLEIVKHTMNKEIKIPFFNDRTGKPDEIEFGNKTFNYFDFSNYLIDESTGEILIDDYRFSMPSVGSENCLSNFLIKKSKNKKNDKWKEYNYDFLFFIKNKSYLSFEEIENLVTIFNEDLSQDEQNKIKSIVDIFSELIGYSLQIDGRVIEIKSKLDLETIWQ